jgi:dolichol-phosphate mannosyltransferase
MSVVSPVYNEAAGISAFFNELCKVLNTLPYDFEVLLIDDGSKDGSADAISALKKKVNVTPKLLKLSRNFGKETAVTAGICESQGATVIVLDSDLQHPVEKIPEFIERWIDGADVVVGVRGASGKNNPIKEIGSNLFYAIIDKISKTDIIPRSTDFRLLDRVVANEFIRFTERNRITRGLIDWLGFERAIVEFDANEREFGEASYNYKMLIELAIHSFVSHSIFPLRFVGVVGILMTTFAGILGLFILIEQFALSDPLGLAVSGTAMLTIVILFICGMILASLGIISLYIGMIHGESLNRPLYVFHTERPKKRTTK